MSDQAAPQPGQEDPTAEHGGKGADPYKLHDDAIKASALLENIATGLGHAGAPEKTTASFTKMADACRSLASAMSRAPAPPEKPSEGPPPRETMDSATNDLASQARRP
jgi:hypothetical protein